MLNKTMIVLVGGFVGVLLMSGCGESVGARFSEQESS